MSLESARSQALDLALAAQEAERQGEVKVLLLGPGESGKSTLLRQFRLLHGGGYDEEQRRAYTPVVHANTMLSARTLVRQAAAWGVAIPSGPASTVTMCDTLTPQVAAAVAELWADAGVQRVYAERARFQLMDSASYFLSRAATLAGPDYVPSVEEILRARVRTSGIHEVVFQIEGVPVRIVDVGGQRNERRKWLAAFEGVTAVLFVAALDYDGVLEEDPRVNRLSEALDLFHEIGSGPWFEHSALILFLNKRDQFEEKLLAGNGLRSEGTDDSPPRFLDFKGGCSIPAARQYLLNKFLALARRDQLVLHHFTEATDTANVQLVWDAIKDAVLKGNQEPLRRLPAPPSAEADAQESGREWPPSTSQ